jgi:hypothetical protein
MGSTTAGAADSAALGRSGSEEMGATPVVAAAEVVDSSAAVSVVDG